MKLPKSRRPVAYAIHAEKLEIKAATRASLKELERAARKHVRELNRLETNQNAAFDQIARIARHKSVGSIPQLRKFMKHPDKLVRARAAEILLRFAENKPRHPSIKRVTKDVNK